METNNQASDVDSGQSQHINTSGGTAIIGNVNTEGGDFVSHDKVIYQSDTSDANIIIAIATEGSTVSNSPITIGNVSINVYQNISPAPLDKVALDSALNTLSTLPVDTIPPIGVLPPGSRIPYGANPLFVGRENELLKLAVHFKGGENIAIGQIAAATGLGGIGKTQLAAAFAHHYGRFFAGGVHWLSFANPENIPTEIAACGLIMPDLRADYITFDIETQVRIVLSAWQSPLPRLLVFDNCEDPSLFLQWRPPTGGSRVLITGRRSIWEVSLGVSVLILEVLTRLQSVELLCRFRPDLSATDSYLNEIAAELGDLPLALHLAGSYLARYRYSTTPDEYLTQLRASTLLNHRSLKMSDIFPQADDLSPTKHVQHVSRTFALSYNKLISTELTDRLAIRLLIHAACLAPGEVIPRSLLLITIKEEYQEGRWMIEDSVQRLVDLGLLEEVVKGGLRLHRLVTGFVRNANSTIIEAEHQVVITNLLEEADRINHTGIPGPLLAWQGHLRYITETVRSQANAQSASLCNTFGFHLHMIGEYAAAKLYYENALPIRENVLGKWHPDTATSYYNLGALLHSMGDYSMAKTNYEQALTIRETLFGDQHSDTATSYNSLGMLLKDIGEYTSAKSYLERCISVREAVLGLNHPDTATGYNDLGQLMDEMGEFEAAKPYYERALAVRKTILGEQHPDTATSYNNLGTLLYANGEYDAAKPYLERALIIREIVFGEKHPHTALMYNNLANLLQSNGEYKAAKPYYERALAIREEVLGGQHPDTAFSYSNLGTLLYVSGNYQEAELYLKRALAIRETVLGDQHPNTAISYSNLGMLMYARGDYANARFYFERTLAIQEVALGHEHPHTALTCNTLGRLLQIIGEFANAKPYIERALKSFEAVLGTEHPNTARSYNSLGMLFRDMRELTSAKLYLERALRIRESVLGSDHPDTALSYNNMGLLLQDMGEPVAAKPYIEQALAIYEVCLGVDHPTTLATRDTLTNLGDA